MESFNARNDDLDSETIAWSASYAVVGTVVVVINTLTLWIFIRITSLRTKKHVVIINLVVADLLFGAIGLPFQVVFLLKPTIISFFVYRALNTFIKEVALFTVGVIAVERMHAIVWPMRHQVLTNKVYKIALGIIWVLSAFLATAMICFHESGLLPMSLLHDLLVPLVITAVTSTVVGCYVAIWISVSRRKRLNLGAVPKQDKTLAVTLLVVAGTFLVCWGIPLFYLSISRMKICKDCYQVTTTFFRVAWLISAVQSMANPVIYCFRLPEFKASLKVKVHDLRCSQCFGSRQRHSTQRSSTKKIEMVNFKQYKVTES